MMSQGVRRFFHGGRRPRPAARTVEMIRLKYVVNLVCRAWLAFVATYHGLYDKGKARVGFSTRALTVWLRLIICLWEPD